MDKSLIKRMLRIINSELSYIHENNGRYKLTLPVIKRGYKKEYKLKNEYIGSYDDYGIAYYIRRRIEYLEYLPILENEDIPFDYRIYSFLTIDPFSLIGAKFLDKEVVKVVTRVKDITFLTDNIYVEPSVEYYTRRCDNNKLEVFNAKSIIRKHLLFNEYISELLNDCDKDGY